MPLINAHSDVSVSILVLKLDLHPDFVFTSRLILKLEENSRTKLFVLLFSSKLQNLEKKV